MRHLLESVLLTLIVLELGQTQRPPNTNKPESVIMYVKKSLQICHYKTSSLRVHTSSYYYLYKTCINQVWRKCQFSNTLRWNAGIVKPYIVMRQPCLYNSYQQIKNSWAVKIQARSDFQVNLTFIKIELMDAFTGCIYGRLVVSILIFSLFFSLQMNFFYLIFYFCCI